MRVKTVSVWTTALISFVVALFTVEARFMNTSEASIVHAELRKSIGEKASKQNVKEFRTLYIEEQLDELKFRRFQITKQATLTPDDEYTIQAIDSRIDKLERLILL